MKRKKLPLTDEEQTELEIKQALKWCEKYTKGSPELKNKLASVVNAIHSTIYEYRMKQLASVPEAQIEDTNKTKG
jgi:hypothetical protein